MYEINAENLKWAFYKLKSYFYYYNSSLYMKDKILEIDNKFKQNPLLFDEIAFDLISEFYTREFEFKDSKDFFKIYKKIFELRGK